MIRTPGSNRRGCSRSSSRSSATRSRSTVMPGHGASTTIGAETPWIRLLREQEYERTDSRHDIAYYSRARSRDRVRVRSLQLHLGNPADSQQFDGLTRSLSVWSTGTGGHLAEGWSLEI